ncbi:ion transport peptide-like [Pollicipes pollicipes]|uniref:ion transport peptide-like n=1 Tax=Pollicipes pollicipes TaxID=41117 RepID=UPI001884991E|nr:ion transport peptide-like [Pollicipes pollicipes]
MADSTLIWGQTPSSGQPVLAGRLVGRPYTALEFRDLECGGEFDRALVAQLSDICQDCYRIYREPELFGLCRRQCFSTPYFGGCLQALHITDPEELGRLHGAARILQG